MSTFEVQPDGERSGHCDCCGKATRTVWGYISRSDETVAAYFVQWTEGALEHDPNFDFLIGTWGNDAVHDKKLVSYRFRASSSDSGSFMAIDSSSRPAASSPICDKPLSRDEVINNPAIMELSTSLINAVWLSDPRIEELKNGA